MKVDHKKQLVTDLIIMSSFNVTLMFAIARIGTIELGVNFNNILTADFSNASQSVTVRKAARTMLLKLTKSWLKRLQNF